MLKKNMKELILGSPLLPVCVWRRMMGSDFFSHEDFYQVIMGREESKTPSI